jgi:hypothetical protein
MSATDMAASTDFVRVLEDYRIGTGRFFSSDKRNGTASREDK